MKDRVSAMIIVCNQSLDKENHVKNTALWKTYLNQLQKIKDKQLKALQITHFKLMEVRYFWGFLQSQKQYDLFFKQLGRQLKAYQILLDG